MLHSIVVAAISKYRRRVVSSTLVGELIHPPEASPWCFEYCIRALAAARVHHESEFLQSFVCSGEENKQRFWRDYTDTAPMLIERRSSSEDASAMHHCEVDSRSPKRKLKAIINSRRFYIIPTDHIPDIMSITRYLDDAIVISRSFTYDKKYRREDICFAPAFCIQNEEKQALGKHHSSLMLPEAFIKSAQQGRSLLK